MTEQFCDYSISLKLKELGFNEPCIRYFDDNEDLNDRDFHLSEYCFSIPIQTSELQKNEGMGNCICSPLWQQAIDFIEARLEACLMIFYNENIGKWGYRIYPLDERLDWVINDGEFEFGTCKTKYDAIKIAIEKGIERIIKIS